MWITIGETGGKWVRGLQLRMELNVIHRLKQLVFIGFIEHLTAFISTLTFTPAFHTGLIILNHCRGFALSHKPRSSLISSDEDISIYSPLRACSTLSFILLTISSLKYISCSLIGVKAYYLSFPRWTIICSPSSALSKYIRWFCLNSLLLITNIQFNLCVHLW